MDGRILKAIEGQRYLIHRNDEADYADLSEDGVCAEVMNAGGESSLFIERDDEYTLYFGRHHSHYSMEDDADICELAQTIDGILHNRICAVSVGHCGKDGRYVPDATWFAAAEKVRSGDAETLIPDADFCSALRRSGGEMRLEYWDGAKNQTVPVRRDEKHTAPRRSSARLIVFLALFHRYFCHFIFLALLFLLGRPKRQLVLLMGVYLLLYAMYSYVGYALRWKHIYCSYQNARNARMTPDRIDWNTVGKSDCVGVPMILALLGAAGVAAYFVL